MYELYAVSITQSIVLMQIISSHSISKVNILLSTVKLGELQDALDSFEKSLDMAKVQGDTAAEAAIKKALEDVNHQIVHGVKADAEESRRKSGIFMMFIASVLCMEQYPFGEIYSKMGSQVLDSLI